MCPVTISTQEVGQSLDHPVFGNQAASTVRVKDGIAHLPFHRSRNEGSPAGNKPWAGGEEHTDELAGGRIERIEIHRLAIVVYGPHGDTEIRLVFLFRAEVRGFDGKRPKPKPDRQRQRQTYDALLPGIQPSANTFDRGIERRPRKSVHEGEDAVGLRVRRRAPVLLTWPVRPAEPVPNPRKLVAAVFGGFKIGQHL